MTEKQIENIKEKIKRYRARLTGEKRRFGGYFDNGGVRYTIAELYIQIGDYKGALAYYRWFSREFSDDIGFPSFNLLCTFILFQNKKLKEAVRIAYKTAFRNTYLIDLICNKPVVNIDKSEPSGVESLNYANEIFEDCGRLLSKEFKVWLCKLSESDEFKFNLNKFISIEKLIKDEPVGSLRSHLINEASKLQEQLTSDYD